MKRGSFQFNACAHSFLKSALWIRNLFLLQLGVTSKARLHRQQSFIGTHIPLRLHSFTECSQFYDHLTLSMNPVRLDSIQWLYSPERAHHTHRAMALQECIVCTLPTTHPITLQGYQTTLHGLVFWCCHSPTTTNGNCFDNGWPKCYSLKQSRVRKVKWHHMQFSKPSEMGTNYKCHEIFNFWGEHSGLGELGQFWDHLPKLPSCFATPHHALQAWFSADGPNENGYGGIVCFNLAGEPPYIGSGCGDYGAICLLNWKLLLQGYSVHRGTCVAGRLLRVGPGHGRDKKQTRVLAFNVAG